MPTTTFIWLSLCVCLLTACATAPTQEDHSLTLTSPNKTLQVEVMLTAEGQPAYTLLHNGQTLIDTSTLGFELREAPALRSGFQVMNTQKRTIDETWDMPWGEQLQVRNHGNELRIDLQESGELGRQLTLIFRAYDDGIGFRYEFPQQPNLAEVVIMGEESEFQLTGDHKAWWIPGDWDIYEHLYNETRLSGIDATTKRDHPNLAQTYIPYNAVSTPITMKTDDGVYLSFHEAALYDYSGMTLRVDTTTFKLSSELVGGPDDVKVTRQTPFKTPWRTIQVATRAADLIESKLIVNLNEPNQLGDVSWFTPMKYAGIWWEMHLGKASWDMASGKHGATTENAKRYIDFCAENGLKGLLVEGWNTGWERWIGFPDREGVFDFVTPYEDYDIEEVARYAAEKGVEIIMHHETSAAPRTYDQQMEAAYQLCEDLGIHSVKSGYVGKIIPDGYYHHGQWMVQHYQRVVEMAAKHKVAVNAHEPIKATGKRRTWPNIIAREGLRGQEFNAWASDGGNPPNHLPTVAFTRMLAGPIDFTPGIFNIKMTPYKDETNQINTTLAQQLALYVVIYSPIQMAADLPEHYEGQPAFQFIRDVAVDWAESRVLDGEVGEFVTIARKDRKSENWFLGSITNEDGRDLSIKLDFLEEGTSYQAHIYRDAADSHWNDNPTAIEIESKTVTSADQLDVQLAPGGGVAVSFMPVK